MTTQTQLEAILKARGEYPVIDPEKRVAYSKGIVVGLDDEEVLVPEENPLFEAAVQAGGLVVLAF